MDLFGKAKDKATLVSLLVFIVNGTQGPTGNAVVPVAMADKIEKLQPGLIARSAGAEPDVVGNISVYATSKGVAAVQGEGGAVAEAEATPKFALEEGFPVPERTRRGGVKGDVYPFALMSVGQSFFVPATEKRPNPAKALGSTISSANLRFATTHPATIGQGAKKKPNPLAGQPTDKDGRKFTVRARTTADGEKSNGARVYRIS